MQEFLQLPNVDRHGGDDDRPVILYDEIDLVARPDPQTLPDRLRQRELPLAGQRRARHARLLTE